MNEDSRYILLVDDDRDDQFLFNEAFLSHKCDLKLIILSDGQQALHYLENCIHAPSLMVLDYNMPKMNGADVIKAIKQQAHLCHIPIVILSTASIGHIDCREHGARECFEKPSDHRELIEITGKIIALYQLYATENQKN